MNRYTVITLFPELLHAFRVTGVVGRAYERGQIAIDTINPREFTNDRRSTVDDTPYGGGPGMVMMAAPLRAAANAARAHGPALVVYLSPQGQRFHQRDIARLSAFEHLVLVAGRYEGIDERIVMHEIDEEWSVGDFVVSGGEVPAMLMIDAIVRTLPETLGDACSARQDSFSDNLLDYPQYTRPEVFDGQPTPPVLLSGHHAEIAAWRRAQQIGRTWSKRPDLLPLGGLSAADQVALADFLRDQNDFRVKSPDEML